MKKTFQFSHNKFFAWFLHSCQINLQSVTTRLLNNYHQPVKLITFYSNSIPCKIFIKISPLNRKITIKNEIPQIYSPLRQESKRVRIKISEAA